jgi:hypothetical protein
MRSCAFSAEPVAAAYPRRHRATFRAALGGHPGQVGRWLDCLAPPCGLACGSVSTDGEARAWRRLKRLLVLLGASGVLTPVTSCGGTDDIIPAHEGGGDDSGPADVNWGCVLREELSDGRQSCDCSVIEPGASVEFNVAETAWAASAVAACPAFDCCLSSGSGDDSTCHCDDSADSCTAQSASRTGARVAATCPPGSTPPETTPDPTCSAQGEACTGNYMIQTQHAGCCAGLACRYDVENMMACR